MEEFGGVWYLFLLKGSLQIHMEKVVGKFCPNPKYIKQLDLLCSSINSPVLTKSPPANASTTMENMLYPPGRVPS